MAADHPLAGRASVSLQDLGAYPMALTEPGTTTRRLFELGCELESVQIEPALSCNDPSPLHGFVYGSDAIMLGAYISVTHSLDRDQLVAVPISNAELQSRSLQIQVMQGRCCRPRPRRSSRCCAASWMSCWRTGRRPGAQYAAK